MAKTSFGKKRKGRVPNPAEGALTLLVNPSDPPEDAGNTSKGAGKMAGKKKSNPKKKKKKSGGSKKKKSSSKKKKNPSNPPKKKKKRKYTNPEMKIMKWDEGLEGNPQAVPAILTGLGGWATPGLIAALIGPQARKQLATTMRGSANGQLLISALSFGGLWALSSYWKEIKPYRKALLMGAGIRLFFDLANAALPRQPGSMASNVRAFLGLPGGDMTLQLPGQTSTGGGATGSKGVLIVKKVTDAGDTYFENQDTIFEKGNVTVKDGKYYDKSSGKLLVKADGKTPWTTTDATLTGGADAVAGALNGWQNFQPFIQPRYDNRGQLSGWQYFQPVLNGMTLAGYNVGKMDQHQRLQGWEYFQPVLTNPNAGAAVVNGGNHTMGTPPSQTYTNFYNMPLQGAHTMGQSPSRGVMAPPGFVFAGGSGASPQDHQQFEL